MTPQTGDDTRNGDAAVDRGGTHSVLLVPRDHLFWDGMRRLLEGNQEWTVVADVVEPHAAERAVATLQPDVILVAGDAGGEDLPTLLTRLHTANPDSRMVVVAEYDRVALEALAGPNVMGCWQWDGISASTIGPGLEAVRVGWRVHSVTMGGAAWEASGGEPAHDVQQPRLTDAEHSVLARRMAGQKLKDIATATSNSQREVDAIIHDLKVKFGAPTTLELCATAQSLGFLAWREEEDSRG